MRKTKVKKNTKIFKRSLANFRKILNKKWWENRVKYLAFFQRFFLLANLSKSFPATLNIEPTNHCNLDCSFCPTRKTNRPFGFMDFKLYLDIIDQIPPKKLRVLWLNKDGESLLHQEIDKMVGYAQKRGVAGRVEIYTNGILLSKEMAKKLIKADLDSLVVSLDAVNRASFKKLKKKDKYNLIVNNILNFFRIRQSLGKIRPLLSVKMVDMGEREEVEKFKRQWEKVADCVIIQPLHTWEGSVKFPIHNFQFSKEGKRYPCNLPWLSPAVFWDGKVVPCCVNYNENELLMGDLKKQTLSEIWQGEKYKKLRSAHLKQDFSDFPTCKLCHFWRQLPNMEWWLKI